MIKILQIPEKWRIMLRNDWNQILLNVGNNMEKTALRLQSVDNC